MDEEFRRILEEMAKALQPDHFTMVMAEKYDMETLRRLIANAKYN